MYELNLAKNITRLRRDKKIKQEELADFLGVTKASVSKWENAQSIPDIMLLLSMASFFDVTIDNLLGYEPQLSREQIRRCYAELCGDFVGKPFDEVIRKIRSLAHRYYSCYPLLLQLCILYVNHYMLAERQEKQEELLKEAVSWCGHILEGCGDVGLCRDALVLKAGLKLQLGKAAEVIGELEPVTDPVSLSGQEGAILTQAYCMTGENEKAKGYIQVKEYQDLLNLVGDAALALLLYGNDMARCESTIERIRGVIKVYRLEKLHPNMAAQFHYQTAVVYALNGRDQDALEALVFFEKCVRELLGAEKLILHEDEYFDMLDAWIERLPLGEMAPRDKSLVWQNMQEIFNHPAFERLKENKEFQRLTERLTRGGEKDA